MEAARDPTLGFDDARQFPRKCGRHLDGQRVPFVHKLAARTDGVASQLASDAHLRPLARNEP